MRRGNTEAVLPPLRSLAAYPTGKYFILLDGYSWFLEISLFPPERERPPLSTQNFSFFSSERRRPGGKRGNARHE